MYACMKMQNNEANHPSRIVTNQKCALETKIPWNDVGHHITAVELKNCDD